MATQVQFRRGTTSQNNAFTGAQGEFTVDTEQWTIRIHDGTTPGGRQVPTLTATQTFTNKTMSTGSVWNGNAVGLGYGGTGAALSGVAGAVVYSTGSAMALSLAGTSGQVLTSGGTSGPTWVNASALSTGTATTATTATNIAGGSAGYLVYQQDTNTTSFIAPGNDGYVLRSTGASTAPTWVTPNFTLGTTAVALGTSETNFTGINTFYITGTTDSSSDSTGVLRVAGGASVKKNLYVGGNAVVTGNLTVNGTTTTINSTTLSVDDKNIELGSVDTPTNTTANGGGITLKGDTDKTIIWDSANSNWTSSEHWNIASGKSFKIATVPVLTSTTVLNDSSQTSIGIGGYATTISMGASTGTTTINHDLGVNGGDIVTTATTFNLLNANATTVTAFGAATALTLGASSSATLTVNPGTVVGYNTTQNLFNTTATTVNAFGAATTIGIGAATGTLTVNNAQTVFNSNKSIQVPVGTTAQRPTAVTGQIRYNTDLSTFEGYAASAWGSLGGVTSVDKLTYIIAETSAGASNGELEFYAEDGAGTAATKVLGLNYSRMLEKTGTVVGSNTTQNLFNTVATTLNIGGAATTVSLGASTGTVTINNATESTATNNGGLVLAGGLGVAKNIQTAGSLYVGSGAYALGLTAPIIVAKNSGSAYTQIGLINSTDTGSADYVAYGDNGDDTGGWADIGMTGSNFSDSSYTITGKNDGYFFVLSKAGAGLAGNMVLATGGAGTTNDIVFATGGFLSANEKMRFINSTGQFYIKTTTDASSISTGVLRVDGGVGIAKKLYVGTALDVGTNATVHGTLAVTGDQTNTGDLAVNGGDITTTSTTGNLFNTNATTVNIANAATTVTVGAGSGTTTVNNNLVITGSLTVNGTNNTSTSNNTAYADSLIDLHYTNGGVLASDDGKDIGLLFNYYKTSDKNAYLVLSNDLQEMEFYSDGTDNGTIVSGTYGTFKGAYFDAVTGFKARGSSSGSTIVQAAATASGTLTLPAATDVLVGRNTTDTLTNKTLTAPVIATIVNSGTLNLPTSSDTLVGRATTDTLTNKTFDTAATGNVFKINGTTLTDKTGTGKVVLDTSPTIVTPTITTSATFSGSTSGSTALQASAVAGSTTVILPAANDTLVGKATTDTLTNKTIDLGSNTLTTTSAQLRTAVSDETGSGSLVFANTPTLVTPVLGVATATSINKLAITAPATSATLTIADGKTLTASNSLTFTGTDSSSVAFGTGGTVVYTSNKLSALSSTTSSELAGVISDETGSGKLVFGTSPTITTSLVTDSTTFNLVNTTATTVNIAGAGTTVSIGASTGTTTINNGLTVTGDLVVNGTTTTVNSTTVTIDNNIFGLGGDTAPTVDDSKDKGNSFRWHNGTTAKQGFFGFKRSTSRFAFIPDASIVSDVASGTLGDIDVNNIYINGTAATGTGGVVRATSPTLVTPTLGVATATSINGLTISSSTGTLSVANSKTLTASNTLTFTGNDSSSVAFGAGGTVAYTTDTHYIGTTAVTLSRSSANLALTGISSVTFPGSTSGTVQLIPAATAGTGTVLTMPATTGTIITTGDSGTVTNTMLAGSIANAKLTNSSVTVGTTSISLGSSSTTLAGLTSVSSTAFTGALTGNASTATTLQTARNINGVSFDGSASITIKASTTSALTIGTGLSGSSFDGSGAVTIALASAYGDTTNPYGSKTANYVLAAPNGSSGAPTFRAIVAADIPTLNQNTTGTAGGLSGTPNITVGTISSGALTVTGAITATTSITAYYSDDRLKTRTGNIENALEKVLSLDGFQYHANETAVALGYDASIQEVGLSAQQVQKVLPEVIAPAPIDPQYMTIHYDRVIPLLVEAIKEQQKQIEELKAKLGN